jgi:FOG: FHA domain
MKDIMNRFADTMGENDNACIMTMGNDVRINPFVSEKEQLYEQIDALVRTSEDTNLYASVIKALDTLNTHSSVQAKRCLVILSDGQDDYETGYTREEVEKKIEESNLPIYTVAMLDSDAEEESIDTSKILGSFARISAGGLDLTFGLDGTTADDIHNSVAESIDNSYILYADFSSLTEIEDQGYLQLNLTIEGQGKVSDGYTIDTSEIQSQISARSTETPKPSPTAPQMTSTPENETPVSETQTPDGLLLIIILAAAGVIVIVVIIMIITVRKKHNRLRISERPLIRENMTISIDNQATDQGTRYNTIELKFTRVGIVEGESYTYKFRDQMIIGRSGAKSQLVFAKDELLSGQHCRIYQKDKKLFIEDMNSTNGTYLNGVSVQTPHMLEQDDIILLGSMELRVGWKEF